ncbi:MAG: 50S ribosomal protein L22 [Candidatus Shapirobacteria bacterium]|nr:50S ribosomal protein L22 [Candidatus Shapirobacteria bacterium]MDD5073928.1 50S ribosomal protein L22 [Candidatus Shapirobacteria bacterium]MDD5481556.1 50S ribosomal protein L22 [Candidatus Shapirobacteria bacterium]
MVQVRAEGKHLPISPRKLRLAADVVRGKKLSEALTVLDHLPQKGAKILRKVVVSASANATNNFSLSEDSLFLTQVIINEGARYKRLDYSHGARFNGGMIKRRRSHLKVVLEEKEEKTVKTKESKDKKAPISAQKKKIKPKKTVTKKESKK